MSSTVRSSFAIVSILALIGVSSLVALGCRDAGDNDATAPGVENQTPAIESERIAEDGGAEPESLPSYAQEPADADASAEIFAGDLSSIESRAGNEVFVKADTGCGPADPAFDHPFDTRSVNVFDIIPEIHAGLLSHTSDGLDARPELAESFTESADFKTFEFRLREGLRFSDGSPLTASDVKWSWQRALSKANGSSRANDVFGSIEGADANLAGVEIVDDRRIKISLSSARPDFVSLLADPVASVLKRGNADDWPTTWDNDAGMSDSEIPFTLSTMPVGAGPYKLIDYTPDLLIARCQLEKNVHYWSPDVAVDRVIAVTPSAEALLTLDDEDAFENGIIDYYMVGLSFREKSGEDETPYGRSAIVRDAPRTWFVIFNPAQPPFDDADFRRSLVAATDLSLVFPYADVSSPRLVPSSMAEDGDKIVAIPFDPDAAADDLAVSKYSQSATNHSVQFPSGGIVQRVLPSVFDQWSERIGLDVRLAPRRDLPDNDSSMPLRLIMLAPAYPDPHAVLRVFIDPFGADNSSEELEQVELMIEEAAIESDPSERRRRYAEIEQLILDEALALPLRIDEYEYEFRVQPWLAGLGFPRFGGSVFRDVSIDRSVEDPGVGIAE